MLSLIIVEIHPIINCCNKFHFRRKGVSVVAFVLEGLPTAPSAANSSRLAVAMPGGHMLGDGGIPPTHTFEPVAGHAFGAGEDLYSAGGQANIQALPDQRR